MAFPTSPSNGQFVVINGINYQYSSSDNAWKRVPAGFDALAANSLTITANTTSGNVIAGGFYFANGAPFTSSNYGNLQVDAYLAPYYTYANANAATQATSIDTINANLGSYQIYANANAAAQAGYISTLQTQVYSNVNTAAYLAGNVTTGNVFTNALYYANGAPYGITVFDEGIPVANAITGINFVGSGVTATATGANVTVLVTGGGGGGGSITYTAATAPPGAGNNKGDQWYNTSTDTLYEYVYDGISYYWVDITTPVTGNVSTGYVNRKYTATGTGNTYAISTGCTVFNVLVYLNGVAQMPTDDYTISGTTLTVDGTPDAGTIVQIRELPR